MRRTRRPRSGRLLIVKGLAQLGLREEVKIVNIDKILVLGSNPNPVTGLAPRKNTLHFPRGETQAQKAPRFPQPIPTQIEGASELAKGELG